MVTNLRIVVAVLGAALATMGASNAGAEAAGVIQVGERVLSEDKLHRRARILLATTYRDIDIRQAVGREALLNAIVSRELLLEEGRRRLYREVAEDAHEVSRLAQRHLIEKLFDHKIEELPLNEEDLRSFYREHRYDVQVLTQHAVCESDAKARDALSQLDDGKSFSEVVTSYTASRLLDRYGKEGMVGWVPLGEMLPETIEVVSTMEVGTIYPKPVQTDLGHHIIRLQDRREAPFDSVRTTMERKLKAKRRAEARLAHTNEMRQRYQMQLHPQAVEALAQIPASVDRAPSPEVPLVSWEGGAFTAGDYMERYRFGNVRHPADQPRSELEKLIDNLAGHRVMLTEAGRLGLSVDPATREEMRRKADQLLIARLVRTVLPSSSEITEDQIRAHYDKNPKMYTRRDGEVLPYENLRGRIRAQLSSRMENQSMDAFIDSLQKTIEIEIDSVAFDKIVKALPPIDAPD